MQIKLSAIDRKILRLLQHNADLSAAEVAERGVVTVALAADGSIDCKRKA